MMKRIGLVCTLLIGLGLVGGWFWFKSVAQSRKMPTDLTVVSRDLLNVPVETIEAALEGKPISEAMRMYLAIAKGIALVPGRGWFGPGQSRYDWQWLNSRLGHSPATPISSAEFPGSSTLFSRLDRNHDDRLSADDFDWSDAGRTVDPFLPGDAPTKEVLLESLFNGELGAVSEGPDVNQPAPSFSLMTVDGRQRVGLTDVLGKKPLVLVFGSLTCGPFRNQYAGVESVYSRFREDATFLMVYVREAHPTTGWRMQSNAQQGVEQAQPRTYKERTVVATQCRRLLKPAFPLLVDEIDDPIGTAYSGSPARLYVIDREGLVTYKGGRGPFGFKPLEMEQALVMTLLDQQLPPPFRGPVISVE